jgi:hypothetical protein
MKNILYLLIFTIIPGTAYAGERLSNDELKSYFTGMTITALHFMRNDPEKYFFESDGVAYKKAGSEEAVSGTWWIDETTNMICTKWNNKNKTFCFYTELDGEGNYYQTGKTPGKVLYEIKSRQQGNQL